MTRSLQNEIKQTRPFSCLEQEAYLSLGRTWAELEHELSEALRPHDITPTQYNVLRILQGAGQPGLCRGEVIDRMITRVPDATRLLDRMEAAGLIARARSAEDRRYVTTRITEEGLRLVAAIEKSVEELHRRQFTSLSEEDLQRLVRLLELVRDA